MVLQYAYCAKKLELRSFERYLPLGAERLEDFLQRSKGSFEEGLEESRI